ncbi:hypothetical protein BDV34DRAFT_235611 [Aspergillus parasiticus]|uniref:Uncharacterized protein n=1 Tax=Aspergillus parasiticus TaxID=5067 RepID=A0A5N6DIH8_ASPPA|nr:hypothetical protein BDV34DRAFT_235611 [Aspergillus parasiticus]
MTSSRAGDYVPLATLNTATYGDTEETQNEWPKPAEQKTRNAWERIGTLSILILLLGSGFLFIPLVLLGLIWRESMTAISGGVPNIFWIRIVHANWTSRLVTVCTAVIRAIVTLQASLITAMVSSIILEGIGTPLFYASFYSIIRVVSGILAQPRRFFSLFISMLVIIEVLVTVASQFLSTILISDFMDSSFISSNNLTEVGIFRPLGFTEAAWWRVPPASSWTFGELTESFSQGPNFHDTGHTYRAFIPFQDEAQRTSLRSFQGPAEVMDQRVVCVSPSFVDLRLNSTFPPRLFGQMTLGNESYPILQDMETQGPINFTCALPFPSKNTTYGMSSLCYPLLALTSNTQLEDPLVNINPDDRIPLYSGYNNPLASPMLIVLDILDGVAMMARNLENITTPYRVTNIHKDGPWSIIMNGSNTAALRVSSCFTNLVAKTFTVDMASSWQNWEPRLSWDRNSNSFDTESVRRQLGASLTPDSLNHRGVLALNSRSEWEDFDMGINAIENDFNEFDTYFHFTTTFLNLLPTPQQALTPPDFPRANQGILLSEANTADTSTADRSYTDIFKDVLHDTNSPALALQALITRGTQAAYYENLMREDPITSALTAFSSTTLIPARWDGFVAGVSIIVAHFIILALITVLFVIYTRNSMIGNSWQAVAQVVSEDMLPVLDQACMEKDGEVKKRWGKDQLAHHSTLRYWPNGRVAIGVEAKESPE